MNVIYKCIILFRETTIINLLNSIYYYDAQLLNVRSDPIFIILR